MRLVMIGMIAAMLGGQVLLSQPSINEAITQVLTPVVDPVSKGVLPHLTEPLEKVSGPTGDVLGEVFSYTPVGFVLDGISALFDKPEPMWVPDEQTLGAIDDATRARIGMAAIWQAGVCAMAWIKVFSGIGAGVV